MSVWLLVAMVFMTPRSEADSSDSIYAPVPGLFSNDAGGLTQPVSTVITWDGTSGVAINSLVGADRFYNVGVWGQYSVTANVEAGLIWNGHETTSTLNDYYVSPGAAGEVDEHATWVGGVLAGYNPNADPYNYPYYQLGMAPLTLLSSGAIATDWYNATDPSTGQTQTYFDITPQTFYSAYNYYFTKSWAHTVNYGGGISFQFFTPTSVINSSWGYEDSAGLDPYTKAADGLARANPLTTLVVAAGNSNSPTNSSNNVGGPASGYNSISVGAVGNYTVDQFTTIAVFSSRGPQDYYDPVHGLVPSVRAPVDIVAPGTSLVSAYYGGQTGGNGAQLSTTQVDTSGGANNYYSLGLAGTSFAAPIVSGGVSLLKSLSYLAGMTDNSRDTRVIKSVLMNSATKLPGWDNGQYLNTQGVTVTTQALDWSQGAGMLNLNQAYDQYTAGTMDVPGTGGGTIAKIGWDYGSLQYLAHNDYLIQSSLQKSWILDVTLTWFRNLSAPIYTDNADPTQQTLTTQDNGFANLFLQIWNADFTQLYASSQSIYNSAQELYYTLPADGSYALRVSYDGQMFGTPVDEAYGLAWNVEEVPEPGITVLLGVASLIVLGFRWKKSGLTSVRLSVFLS